MSSSAAVPLQRLQRLLVSAGVARSRRAADVLIAEGRVLINGTVAALGVRVGGGGGCASGGGVTSSSKAVVGLLPKVTVDGRAISFSLPSLVPKQSRVVIVNKPRGMVSAWGTSGPRLSPRATLDSLSLGTGLMHVGRLDADSEGLLLVTNDGTLANSIAHPSTGPPKTYLLTVAPHAPQAHAAPTTSSKTKTTLSKDVAAALTMAALCARLTDSRGILLAADERDGPAGLKAAANARPARALAARHISHATALSLLGGESSTSASLLRLAHDADFLEIVLGEGRKRLARRLVAACGWRVDRLIRIAVGPIRLGSLASGESRELEQHEIAQLIKSTKSSTSLSV